MFVIASNNGPWDSDMWGVVGLIRNRHEFYTFVQSHGSYTDDEMEDFTHITGEDECDMSYEEYEVSLICSAISISYLTNNAHVYYLMEFR